MDKYTQIILSKLDYNQLMLQLLTPKSTDKLSLYDNVYKMLLIISLTTGLPLRSLFEMKWGAIFETSSKGKISCKEYLSSNRQFDFPISSKIQKQLLDYYNVLNQPNFDLVISDSPELHENPDRMRRSITIKFGIHDIEELEENSWKEYQNENLSQILFGRRIFEICGYSNYTSKFLKGLYKIKTNKKLFEFLGYESLEQINYELSKISIVEGLNQKYSLDEPRSFLDDNKHFLYKIEGSDKYYPFQHFQVFYDFLKSVKLDDGLFKSVMPYSEFLISDKHDNNSLKSDKRDIKSRSVLILLMLGLTNGIRLSTLLNLKWSDIFYLEKNGSSGCAVIRTTLKLGRRVLNIDSNTKKEILSHFRLLMEEANCHGIPYKDRLIFLHSTPSLSQNCFVTSQLNPLTQPSLSREIKKALSLAGFQHVEKFTTKSTMIMYGRRIIEIKGNHPPTIKALKKHFNLRSTQDLFNFLYISNKKKTNIPDIGEFSSVFEHILYDI